MRVGKHGSFTSSGGKHTSACIFNPHLNFEEIYDLQLLPLFPPKSMGGAPIFEFFFISLQDSSTSNAVDGRNPALAKVDSFILGCLPSK